MEKRSLLDQLVHGVAGAVGDIREKLMEGWFGPGGASTGAAGEIGAPTPAAAPMQGVHRTNVDLHVGDNITIDSANVDMRQQNMATPMRSWDDICADIGPVRGSAPDPERERGMDI